MISVETRKDINVLVIKPEEAISEASISKLQTDIDSYINIYDKIPNLVLKVDNFPFWENFNALAKHLKLISEKHKLIRKVAIVTDSTFLSFMRGIVDQFTGAKIRRFKADEMEKALSWTESEENYPGIISVIEGLPNDVIGLDASGIITSKNYRETILPLIEDKLKRHEKLKFLYVLGKEFDGYSAGALWDDASLGINYFTTFTKIAIVTDVDWIRHGAKVFGPLVPAEVLVFDLNDIESAKGWIKT